MSTKTGPSRILYSMMSAVSLLRSVPAVLIAGLFLAACGDPPLKEMNLAQGALDAARAAGADLYAPDAYQAAASALGRSREAVAERDYRLALNHALDAFERAQEAAKAAANHKAVVRSEAEHALNETTKAIAEADERLNAARTARIPRAALASLERAVAAATTCVQEARAALSNDDYLSARDATCDAAPLLRQAVAEIDEEIEAQEQARRRRR
jgi:hypothetical protein